MSVKSKRCTALHRDKRSKRPVWLYRNHTHTRSVMLCRAEHDGRGRREWCWVGGSGGRTIALKCCRLSLQLNADDQPCLAGVQVNPVMSRNCTTLHLVKVVTQKTTTWSDLSDLPKQAAAPDATLTFDSVMGRLGMWTWTLCVLLGWMCVDHAVAGPQYMVAIPSVLEVGTDTKTCISLLQPNETLTMTVTLVSEDTNAVLFQKTSGDEFHTCVEFKVPLAKNDEVHKLEVEVRGATFYSKEVRKVMTRVYEPMTFVQTDKPIYLPGQTVHFRVVSLDSMFRPVSRLYNLIALEDANVNRIGQWWNETSDGKILQRSFALNAEAREGEYRIIVTIGQEKIYHFFKVEKYVLPKFDVKIDMPDEVSVKQEEIKAEVCAKYTYGQPVPGNVRFQMCRPLSYHIPLTSDMEEILLPDSRCHEEIKPTDKTGCAAFTIKMATFQKFDPKILRDALDIRVKVEEEGTGVSHPQEKRTSITYKVGTLSFVETAKIYEKGTNVEGKIKAVSLDNTPIPDFPVYLFEGETWDARRLQNLTTDSDGIATFTLDTTNMVGDVSLKVSNKPTMEYHGYRMEYYETGTHQLSMVQKSTPDDVSVSSLTLKTKDGPLPCDSEQDFTVQYSVVGETQGSADILYLILSKGAIVMQGNKEIEVEDKPVTKGEMSFKVTVTAEMSPEIQILVYAVLPSENVIAQKAEYSTEKCFSNKVSVEFSPPSAVPGEMVTMQVTAQPESLCGLSAVDQSVLIKEPGKTLSVEKIMDLLPAKKLTNIPYQVEDQVECLPVRPKRYILPYPVHERSGDAFKVFESLGLKMATNMFIREPTCLKFRGKEYHHGRYTVMRYDSVPHLNRMTIQYGMASPGVGSAPRGGTIDLAPVETARSFFPETWIWDLVEVGDSGRKDVPYTAPDTITTWETEAFCMSPQGFGLAPRKEIRVFQPFFIDLTLPYSIVRGEHFELKATTFNYLPSCIMITVTPEPSLDYTLTPLSGDQYTSCLCGSERKTLSWTMAPTVLGVMNISVTAEALASQATCDNEVVTTLDRGRIDKVTRSLIVKAEGTEVSKSYNWLLCPKDETLAAEIDIQLPENVIDGSARASVSVLGDILGRALQNLDGMLQMPYGCGEQNMALLAPNIYILQYLKNTQQLTTAIKEKATNFLNSGYQRQLNYKHNSGAYSTFGAGDGNTWLTAFVLRCFTKAQSFIFIDSTKLQQSKAWLDRKQRKNGCFTKSGNLFNNRMKGGVSDEVTLTAYITAAYLEMDPNAKNPVVESSLSCLKESMSDLSNTYTTALMAYVFTLAGDMETRALLLNHLDTVASNQGGFLHWSQSAAETSASLSVEISSYVLLAKLSAQPSAEELGYATRIVRWLTGQQNYYGGFSSTQDTVVALQALALYSTLVFSRDGASRVMVNSPSSQLVFDVNQDNKLLYQEASLKDVAGRYNMEVKGSACAAMQISVNYNIPTPSTVTTLGVQVETEADCGDTTRKPRITLKLKSLYSGKESSTNMVILDIKMLSGFVPDTESLKNLKGVRLVDRVEEKEDHILVYLQELRKDEAASHSLQLVQQVPVQNLKPAVIKIYDYYQPSDQAETEYSLPCPAA